MHSKVVLVTIHHKSTQNTVLNSSWLESSCWKN